MLELRRKEQAALEATRWVFEDLYDGADAARGFWMSSCVDIIQKGQVERLSEEAIRLGEIGSSNAALNLPARVFNVRLYNYLSEATFELTVGIVEVTLMMSRGSLSPDGWDGRTALPSESYPSFAVTTGIDDGSTDVEVKHHFEFPLKGDRELFNLPRVAEFGSVERATEQLEKHLGMR